MKKQIRKLLHRFENLKFRKKLSVLMLIVGLVPVVFLAFSMQYGMTNQLREKEQYNLEKILEQSVNSIENQSQIYENLVDYLSYSQSLRNIFDTEMESDYEKYLKYVKVADPLLQMPTIYHKEIRSITLYSDNIEVPHGDTLLPMSEAENQQWYSRLNEGTLMQWSITRGGNKSIIASRKFYDNDTIKAVLEMRLDYEKVLSPFMSQITDNTGGMILDDNGNVVYADCSMDKKYRPKNIENLKDISDKYYISQRTMKDTGWDFYIYRPKAVSENAIHKLLLKNIPLILISVLLLSLLGYVFSIRMVSQLELLTENMNQINMGLRKVTVQSKSKDEVGVLIRSFQRMMDQMNHLISEVYESKIQLQNSEMRALQAQINPHFLYNTLDSINWMLIEKGEWEISDVVVSLGDILKYSLHGEEMLVLFEEELKYIESYLCIQKNRLEDRLTVQIEIDEEAKLCFVPKLILQPIVENAILHGIEKKKEMGRIQIQAIVREGTLEIRVTDDGIGMQPDRLMRFRESIMSDEISGKHIGMRNVHRRIQLHFGEAYGLKIDSEWQKGTTVTILLPVEEVDQAKEVTEDENRNCR